LAREYPDSFRYNRIVLTYQSPTPEFSGFMFTNRLSKYAIDLVNNQQIRGWVFHTLRKTKPVTLQFYLDHDYIGEVLSSEFREDLKAQMIHPDGRCGFQFLFPPDTDFGSYTNLHIFCGGSKPLCTLSTETIPDIFMGDLPRIFFMHIPKTAGTSFNAFAQQRYPAKTTAVHIEAIPTSCWSALADTKSYLAGHVRLETIRNHFDLNTFDLYTILRQPHRHLHSHFNWIRGIASDPQSSFFQKHPDCIQALGTQLVRPKTTIKITLAHLISGLNGFELDFFDNVQTRYFLDYRPERVTEVDLERALNNFKLFTAIGLTEEYDGFTRQFCTTYKLPLLKQEMPLNKSKHKRLYDINDPEMQTILHPLVEYDLHLYEAAQSIDISA
jgi:hypothetical protein